MDWNGDGKHDWHDDAYIFTVLHSNNEKDEESDDPNYHWSPEPGTVLGWVIAIVVLMILGFFHA